MEEVKNINGCYGTWGGQEWEMTSEPDYDDLLILLLSNINCTSRFKYGKGYCDDCKEEVEIEEYEE